MRNIEQALKKLIEALEYHTEQTRPIQKTIEAIGLGKAALSEIEKCEPVLLNNMTNSPEHVEDYIRQQMPDISKELVALMTSPSIQECVSRFLNWKLPSDFSPDAGISFNKLPHLHDTHEWPIGTNLLNADQAKDMLEHILTGAHVELYTSPMSKEWVGLKITDEELLKYAVSEELLLFASEDDYLAIANGVLELVNIKLNAQRKADHDKN